MTSRIPERPSEHEAEGIPDPGFAEPGQLEAGDTEATTEPPRDVAFAVDDFGTTAAEQHDGEPLDGRLAREEPDVLAPVDLDADESAGSDTPVRRAGRPGRRPHRRAGRGRARRHRGRPGRRGRRHRPRRLLRRGGAMHLEPEV
jgi:hypothetical protein